MTDFCHGLFFVHLWPILSPRFPWTNNHPPFLTFALLAPLIFAIFEAPRNSSKAIRMISERVEI